MGRKAKLPVPTRSLFLWFVLLYTTVFLPEITVRQMAIMTAGFDDGRPPKLVYRPGTKGIYSNDTSNMLAELLTLKLNGDFYPALRHYL